MCFGVYNLGLIWFGFPPISQKHKYTVVTEDEDLVFVLNTLIEVNTRDITNWFIFYWYYLILGQ